MAMKTLAGFCAPVNYLVLVPLRGVIQSGKIVLVEGSPNMQRGVCLDVVPEQRLICTVVHLVNDSGHSHQVGPQQSPGIDINLNSEIR